MGRRSATVARCGRCRMHLAGCICDAVPRLTLATRLLLVMHQSERHRVSASGPLALLALPHSELRLHGLREAPLELAGITQDDRRVLLLYPTADAAPLTPALLRADPRPVTLVVPDGTWGQASRIARRIAASAALEPVSLPDGPSSRYRLRHTERPGALATLEAIARALGVLEGAEVQQALERLFLRLVESTLRSRGQALAAPPPKLPHDDPRPAPR